MAETDLEALIGPKLASAIAKKGYTALTPVQEAVLDPALAGRDLRISSQTGSGKTVAIGLTLRDVVTGESASTPKGAARPRALVVAPTRELAKQVEVELSWLFAPQKVAVASVTGGGNFRDERRALGAGPGIIVGTPGRLLDHLTRGAIDGTNLGAVVLDEADRMLDLGFRDDLEAILRFAPEGHRTHLVSATFPREVMALANRVQSDPARIEGTPIGAANADIEHLVHLVLPHERLDAIVNLLLETPGATTLIFARTRADVGELTHLLGEAGFEVDALSGEMEQRERNKALAAFKRGALDALVATDVAARGIDVQDVARVLHAEPPMDPDSYTHRSGRTGRAGRKGKSSVLVTPPALNRVSGLLKRAGVRWRLDPVPTAETIEAAREERLIEALTTVAPPDDPAEEPREPSGPKEADDKSWALAKRIVELGEGTRALARMIARTRAQGPEARAITILNPQGSRKKPWEERAERSERAAPRTTEGRPFAEHRSFGEPRGLRPERDAGEATEPRRAPGPPRAPRDAATDAGAWVSFRVTWGQIHGADARRLLAMACRRGGIRGSDVGSIKVARTFSTIDVAAAAAAAFEGATREPDPRDPRVKIRPASEGGAEGASSHADRTERVAVEDRPSKTADRPSKIADRPSKIADRPSRTADRPSETADRPSKTADRASKTADRASKTADRPSKIADRPSKIADRPSKIADRSSRTADRPSETADRASKTADRASKTADRASKTADSPSETANRPSKTADRPSKTADRPSSVKPESDPARASKRTLVMDRPSRSAREAEQDALPPEPAAPPARPSSKAARTSTEQPSAELSERPSRSGPAERRPHSPVAERYIRRAPTPGAHPRNDGARGDEAQERPRRQEEGPRPPFDRSRGRPEGPRYDGPRSGGPRPSHDAPRSGGPRPGGPRPGGPRPSHDAPRPGGPRPSHDAPRSGGPRPSHDAPRPGGPRPGGPRPTHDAPRPGAPRPSHDGPRPRGGPPQPHGDARPKRKKP